jgi:phenylpropionate dioxygenase-like ring-hydroxylating dioxygenase large terminal subunit
VGPAWLDQWYPVACLKDLDPGRPAPFTLLGVDLVLWYEASQQRWAAFVDRCPHRLVPLSEGRIGEGGLLECPYHGWSFDGSGTCRRIPQAEEDVRPDSRRARCHSFATAEAQGLLFVFAGAAAGARDVPLPLIPALEETPEAWLVQDTFRDLPMDATTLLENVLDVSHVPFTHHRTVGRRETAGPVRARVEREGPDGFEAIWPEGPRRGSLGSQHTVYRAPQLMWHDLEAPRFARILTVVYAVPIRPGTCRLFARFPFRFVSRWPRLLVGLRPRWLQHIGNHTVLEDDQVFLHWQERALAEGGGSEAFERACYLPTESDVYVRALHRWLRGPGSAPFPGASLPERQARPALMDRYGSHTVHCRSCAGALARLRRIRPLLWPLIAAALVLAAWSGLGWTGAVALAVALLAALMQFRLGRLEQGLLQGSGEPPRNA